MDERKSLPTSDRILAPPLYVPTGEDVILLRECMGITKADLARLMSVAEASVGRWEREGMRKRGGVGEVCRQRMVALILAFNEGGGKAVREVAHQWRKVPTRRPPGFKEKHWHGTTGSDALRGYALDEHGQPVQQEEVVNAEGWTVRELGGAGGDYLTAQEVAVKRAMEEARQLNKSIDSLKEPRGTVVALLFVGVCIGVAATLLLLTYLR